MPDGHPTKEEALPWIAFVDGVATHARRTRVVNRAYGTQLMPGEVNSLIPEETVETLLLLEEEKYIDDTVTWLRVFLEAMSRR